MIGAALKQLVIGTGRYLRFRKPVTGITGPALKQPGVTLRLDLGCGMSKKQGFTGIDRRSFDGVAGVTDLTKQLWLFEQPTLDGCALLPAVVEGQSGYVLPDNSVAEAHCSHFLEHLEHNQTRPERVRFMNELWRVLIPGGQAKIITPHWASHRAYGDFTHADKPVSEMFYPYLDKTWRSTNAPDNDIAHNPDGYLCDFTSEISHQLHPELQGKTAEEKNFAVTWYKEAVLDLHASLTARKE